MASRRPAFVKFSFPIEAYHPDALRSGYSERELRREYSRLRSIAQKRLQRISVTEFKSSQTYLYNAGRYAPSRELGVSDLVHLLTDLRRFLTASTGSLSGLRAARDKAVESWNEMGYSFVSRSNYQEWTNFLEYAKDRIGSTYRIEIIGRIFKERFVGASKSLATVKRTFSRYYQKYADHQS